MTINSAARQAADLIAEDILAHEGDQDEWLLGSEDELMEQLGVGRPTIRQAARLLEQQQLLVVKRGLRGGFFGRRPSGEGVTSNAHVFLKSQRTTFRQLLKAELVLGPVCAQLAATYADEESRRQLLEYYELHDPDPDALPVRRFMELAPGFQREVARLSGSPVLYLFVGVLMDLAARSRGIAAVYDDPERRQLTVKRHRRVAEAVAEQRGELAARRMRQHLETIIDWADSGSLDLPL